MQNEQKLPGTIWLNRGRYNWKVKLPGTDKRSNYRLIPPRGKMALPENKGISLAESIAWRMWEKASQSNTKPAIPKKTSKAHSVEEVASLFTKWAETYYRRNDGSFTREHYTVELSLRLLRSLYGQMLIDEITYHDIVAARDSLIKDGKMLRKTINQRVGVWKRMFKWALENRLCQPQTKAEVWAIDSLKRHRTTAKEGKGKEPVKHWIVKATLPYLPPTVKAMIQTSELTGARSSEICIMRPGDIEKRSGYWLYRPNWWKTAHAPNTFRVIVFGPRAIEIIKPFTFVMIATSCFHRAKPKNSDTQLQGRIAKPRFSPANRIARKTVR